MEAGRILGRDVDNAEAEFCADSVRYLTWLHHSVLTMPRDDVKAPPERLQPGAMTISGYDRWLAGAELEELDAFTRQRSQPIEQRIGALNELRRRYLDAHEAEVLKRAAEYAAVRIRPT